MLDLPKITRVARRTVENPFDVTLHLEADWDFQPGQFAMVWLPGVNEKPFSIAGRSQDGLMVTARRRGPFSEQLCEVPEGGAVGIRGPYGTGFRPGPKACLVAGGVGFAAVAPLADMMPGIPILYGENDVNRLMYRERFPDTRFYTVDGSAGCQGYPTDALAELIRERGIELVYCCGPEIMLVKTLRICHQLGVAVQASIERYMKCGRGLCGQCACGTERVCADGPVFDGERLLANRDFGVRELTASGEWRYFQAAV